MQLEGCRKATTLTLTFKGGDETLRKGGDETGLNKGGLRIFFPRIFGTERGFLD